MTIPLDAPVVSSLRGSGGELLRIRIAADARHLEDVLEAVAELPFPVNPEIQHGAHQSQIEFPAYSQWLDEIRTALESSGLSRDLVEVQTVLA